MFRIRGTDLCIAAVCASASLFDPHAGSCESRLAEKAGDAKACGHGDGKHIDRGKQERHQRENQDGLLVLGIVKAADNTQEEQNHAVDHRDQTIGIAVGIGFFTDLQGFLRLGQQIVGCFKIPIGSLYSASLMV